MSAPSQHGPNLPIDRTALDLFNLYHEQFAADLRDEASDAALRAYRPAVASRPLIRPEYMPGARERAYGRRRPRFSWRELTLVVGGALFGAGLENGTSEALSGHYTGALMLWILMGAIGAIIVILALALL